MIDHMRLRVVLLTQGDVFHIPFALRRFFCRVDRELVDVTGLAILDPMNEHLPKLAARMLRFLGPADFVRRGGHYVLLRLLGWLGLTWRSPAVLARRNAVRILNVRSVNSPEFIEYLRRERIHVIASISCPQILRATTLQAPCWGCLNVHSGRLPEYRGLMPCFWALYNGEDSVGVSVHTMVEEIDGGKIIRRGDVPIRSTDSWDLLVRRCKVIGGEMMAEALGQIATGEEVLEEQVGGGVYYSFPDRSHVQEFKKCGGRIL